MGDDCMSQYQVENDERIKADKFKEHLQKFGNTLNRILKEVFDPIFKEEPDLAINAFQKNTSAFLRRKDLFPSALVAEKKGFSFKFDSKEYSGLDDEQVFKKATKEFKSRSDNSLNNYIDYLISKADFAIYLKLLKNSGDNKNENKPLKLIKYCKDNFSVDLADEKIHQIITISADCRNKTAHGDDTNVAELMDDENKKKYLNAFNDLANLFLKETDRKYIADVNLLYKRGIEIIESSPISGDEIIRKYPTKFADKNSIWKQFELDYDLDRDKLYSYTEKAFIEKIKQLKDISDYKDMQLKDNSALATIKRKAEINVIRSLLKYDRFLSQQQIKDIGRECPVFIDCSVFEGKNADDGKLIRSFISNNVLEPLKDIKSPALVNHSSRIKMNIDYYKGETEEIRACAKAARDKMEYFIERGSLRFTKSVGTVYEKGIYETVDLAKNNSDQRIFTIVSNDADAKQIEQEAPNCLVAKIFRFQSDRKLMLTQESINKLKDFATGRGYGNVEEIEDTETEKIIEVAKPIEVINSTVEQAKKESVTTVPVVRKKVKNSQQIPKLGTAKECIPENRTFLPFNSKIKEGYVLKTDTQEQFVLGKSLGQGAEGTVFDVNDKIVAKIYNKEHLTKNRYDKLKLMVGSGVNINKVCWPISLIFDENDNFVGYAMQKADERYLELGESVLALNNKKAIQSVPYLKDWDRFRLTNFCYHLSNTFKKIHESNLLVGDINQGNIMVDLSDTQGAAFMIVDTDSFQVGPYPSPVGTPVFTSPEIYKRTGKENPNYGKFLRTLEDEQYALASLLFQILMLGQEPFAGKGIDGEGLDALKEYNFDFRGEKSTGVDTPDGPYRMIWVNIDPEIRKMFEQVFTGGKTIAAKDWCNALKFYAKKIQNGLATNELEPYRYPKTSYMQEFTCPICKRQANLPTNKYNWRKEKGIPNVCTECNWKVVPALKAATITINCDTCGKLYKISNYDALANKLYDKKNICPDCNTVIAVKCRECGNPVKVRKYWTFEQGARFLCTSCKEELKTTCFKCGKPIKKSRWQIRKYINHMYCDNCMPNKK